MQKESPDLHTNTLAERTELLFTKGKSAAGASILAAAVLYFMLWREVGDQTLIIWSCLVLLISGLHYLLVLSYRRIHLFGDDHGPWYARYLISSLAMGGCWGLLSIVPVQTESQTMQLLPSLTIAFVAMAAIPSYVPRLRTYAVFLGALTLTAVIGYALTRGLDGLYLAGMHLLLAPALYASATRFNESLLETLHLRYKQDELLQQMQQTNTALESANSALSQKQAIIDQETEIARHVFQQLIEATEQQLKQIRFYHRAMGSFSGDLIQTAQGSQDKQYVLLGDFTGHGLAAALGAVPTSVVFLSMTRKGLPIEHIAEELNKKLLKLLPTDYYCCAVLMEIDNHSKLVRILNLGLPPVVIIEATGQLAQRADSSNLPLGIIATDRADYVCSEVRMQHNDCYYIHSDGITDVQNDAGDMWGETSLFSVLQQPLQGQSRLDRVMDSLDHFIGQRKPRDDISILEYRAP